MKIRNVLAIVGAIALSAAMAGPAGATALHGFCDGSTTGACVDNGTNTPLGNSTKFGFWLSSAGSGATGTLSLEILVPDNYSPSGGFAVTGINGYPSGTANLVSGTAWTTGDLAGYLGITAQPNNPIGAYLPTTDALDPGATGFSVYQLVLSNVMVADQSSQDYMFNAIAGIGVGGYIVAFFNTGTADRPACLHGNSDGQCATANSGALLVTNVPEPGTLALFGAALGALAFLRRSRRKA